MAQHRAWQEPPGRRWLGQPSLLGLMLHTRARLRYVRGKWDERDARIAAQRARRINVLPTVRWRHESDDYEVLA
jgi:hypothetical protein